MVLPLLITDITEEISGIATVLPLESTVLPVVIPPNFTADSHWYITGNTTAIQLVIPETFLWGSDCKLNIASFRVIWRKCLSVKFDQAEKDIHMYLERFQKEMLEKNEIWPLVMNPYHLNESTFRGIRRFYYLYFIFRCISCEHLQWPQFGRRIFAASHLWPLKNVPLVMAWLGRKFQAWYVPEEFTSISPHGK